MGEEMQKSLCAGTIYRGKSVHLQALNRYTSLGRNRSYLYNPLYMRFRIRPLYTPTLFVCLMVLLLAACKNKPKKFVIGVSQCSEDIWRDKLNSELKMGELLNDSLTVLLASSNDDSEKQIQQINHFIDAEVLGITRSVEYISTQNGDIRHFD